MLPDSDGMNIIDYCLHRRSMQVHELVLSLNRDDAIMPRLVDVRVLLVDNPAYVSEAPILHSIGNDTAL